MDIKSSENICGVRGIAHIGTCRYWKIIIFLIKPTNFFFDYLLWYLWLKNAKLLVDKLSSSNVGCTAPFLAA